MHLYLKGCTGPGGECTPGGENRLGSTGGSHPELNGLDLQCVCPAQGKKLHLLLLPMRLNCFTLATKS